VANWSHEASATNAATMMITPPPHQVPAASWDTSGPNAGTATMVTPIGQIPEAMWGESENPAEAATLAASGSQPRAAAPSPALALDINGEPFPGYEKWQGARAGTPDDDAAFALSDLDH
jgi:hypothetical protein